MFRIVLFISLSISLAGVWGIGPAVEATAQQPPRSGFKAAQLAQSRVKTAYRESEAAVKRLFKDKGLEINASELFLRAFKEERLLELWARPRHQAQPFQLLKAYGICAASGVAGPKRREKDWQVPEGFYVINRWNPQSNFLLSLGINYPNASDRVLSDRTHPGGDIFLHGACASIGCLAMTDAAIQELYVAFVEATQAGQRHIPVHLFPARLSGGMWEKLQVLAAGDPVLLAFWANLKTGHDWFETRRTPPRISVNGRGAYTFR